MRNAQKGKEMVHLTAVLNREYDDRELESLKADIMAFMPYDDLIEKSGGDLDFLDEASGIGRCLFLSDLPHYTNSKNS